MNNYSEIAKKINNGGVALVPTDTNYALACQPEDAEACTKLYDIKQRPPEKPLTLFVANKSDARIYCQLSDEDEVVYNALVEKYWPGPLNIVVKASKKAPKHQYFFNDTVSLACIKNYELNTLMTASKSALALTSANISGTDVDGLVSCEMAEKIFGDRVDAIVTKDKSSVATTISSTIVKIEDGQIKTLRKGDIDLSEFMVGISKN